MIAANRAEALGWAALALGLVLLAAGVSALASVFGLWHDELYSLWASDPAAGLADSVGRMAGDSNPPLYFAWLRAVRVVVEAPQGAILTANVLALLAALGFVIWTSWRANALTLGLFGAAAFTIAGPAFYFIQEGRTFYLCLCIGLAAAWQAALMVADAEAPRRPIWLAALGVAGALSHVYGGLFAGCLAAGLVAFAVLGKRRDLLMPGLAVGLAATVASALWYAYASTRLENIAFLDFSASVVRDALWYARTLTLGPVWMIAPVLGLVGYAALSPRPRPLLFVLGAAMGLFLLLPILVSFAVPIIMGRYWTVGAPALVVLLVFLARAFLERGDRPGLLAAAAAGLVLAATAVTGFNAAHAIIAIEGVWRGAPIVASLARDCPPASVHVRHVSPQPELFAIASNLPLEVFVLADGAPVLDAGAATCPVLGWAEHGWTPEAVNAQAPDEALYQWLGIDAAPDEARIERLDNGYVVLRADANPATP